MRIIAGITIAALAVTNTVALELTCTETARTGLQWETDHWVPIQDDPQTHTVRSVDIGEAVAEECAKSMQRLGMSTEKRPTFSGATSAGCWALTSEGEEPSRYDVSACQQIEVDGTIAEVICNNALFENIRFIVGGEFALTDTFGGIVLDESISDTRDPVALALGRCEVVAK